MKALIWSKPNCTYCVQAKKILELNSYDIELRVIDEVSWTKAQLLESVPSARTVPQIFIDGEYVGGYQEVLQFLNKKAA